MSKPAILFARDGDCLDINGAVVEVHTHDPDSSVCLVVTGGDAKRTERIDAASVRRELLAAVDGEMSQ